MRLANILRWVPTLVLVLLAVNFYCDNVWVKFGRDILVTGANVWFCILTLNPWRKAQVEGDGEKVVAGTAEPVADPSPAAARRYDDLAARLEKLLVEDKIFTEPHITSDTFISRLGTNSKYLTEAIRRSGYQSFYDMICQYRVRHAISLIHQSPDKRLADIAEECGFSSQASMTKAFKSQGKDTPSHYRRG